MIPVNFIWAVGASIVVSLISFIGIFALILKEKTLDQILILLVGISGGALIGAAFFHLIPEALEKSPAVTVFTYLTVGFILFFALERYLRWRHCHEEHCEIHPFSYLNLVGDGIHNLIDGIIIGSSFAVDIRFGLITTTVIVLHEIPQEAGDFGVLVYGGMHKHKALFYNFLSALTAVAGSIIGFYFSERAVLFSQFMIPFAAGGFIYVASCDLIPEIHKQSEVKKATLSMAFFIAGIFFMLVLKWLH
jgi:zinc and cadmium transporter